MFGLCPEQWIAIGTIGTWLATIAMVVATSYMVIATNGMKRSADVSNEISREFRTSSEKWSKVALYATFASERNDIATDTIRLARRINSLWTPEAKADPAEVKRLYDEWLCDARIRRLASDIVNDLSGGDSYASFRNEFFVTAEHAFRNSWPADDVSDLKKLGKPVRNLLNNLTNERLAVDMHAFETWIADLGLQQ